MLKIYNICRSRWRRRNPENRSGALPISDEIKKNMEGPVYNSCKFVENLIKYSRNIVKL